MKILTSYFKILTSLHLLCASAALAQQHCVINEFIYAPLAGEPEWVEIYNPTAQSFNLKNWKIRDLTATKKLITTKDAIIAAGGYLVLARDTSVLNFHFNIPAPIVALSLPSLNNDSDAVILYDADGAIVDSLVYHSTWGGTGGASLERVRSAASSLSGNNWRSSTDIEKSTPGRKNTSAPKPVDASIDTLFAQLDGVNAYQITLRIRSVGEFAVQGLAVRCAVDDNSDSVMSAAECFLDTIVATIPPEGVMTVIAHTPRLIGARMVMASIAVPTDGDSTNNYRSIHVDATHERSSMVINEIMYAPGSTEPEWVEIQNCSSDTIDCSGWHISTGTSTATLSTARPLASGEYCVITRDTDLLRTVHPDTLIRVVYAALPTLSNSGTRLMLRDERNITIDSLYFLPVWGGATGASLERIDSSGRAVDSLNWRTTTDTSSSTCGRRNAVARCGIDAGVSSARLGDDSSTMIVDVRNFGLRNALNITVTAHVDSLPPGTGVINDHVLSLAHGNGATMTVPVEALPAGDNMITVCADVEGDERLENNCVHVLVHGTLPAGTLAINEIMFAPHTNAPEYVELVNISSMAISLYGCRLSGSASLSTHIVDTTRFGMHPMILAPGEYALVLSDTSLGGTNDLIDGRRAFIVDESSLGFSNDSDIVVISDGAGYMIDSVRYRSSWHSPNVKSKTGVALERINPLLPSNERSTWASSVSARGGTPGARNSIFTLVNVATRAAVEPEKAALTVAPNPFSPDGDGREDFTGFQFEVPFQSATYTIRIFDAIGRLRRVLANTARSSAQGLVVWDGRDEESAPLPMGMYIAVLDAVDAFSGRTVRAKASVVVARKL